MNHLVLCGGVLRPLNLESSTLPLSNCAPRLILMVYILIEMNSNAKRQCFIYFSSVSHGISVNLIKRCHYSRYTILTNRSTRVMPSTTIRRIPKTRDKTGMVKIAYRNRELTSYPKINHVFVSSKAVFTAGALSSQY